MYEIPNTLLNETKNPFSHFDDINVYLQKCLNLPHFISKNREKLLNKEESNLSQLKDYLLS